jgi:hypothetical protein
MILASGSILDSRFLSGNLCRLSSPEGGAIGSHGKKRFHPETFVSRWKRSAVSVQPSAKDESKQFYGLSADGYPLKAPSGNSSSRMATKSIDS